ncbi:murein biosynthesis integral membrane protein MurJ [Desulfospira joergensenii]|uniref:murein biosynthesis integral membrane protein MurJ n=1 Tax=Desulfospira joergensenii TaxID=53329 RepID=UPI0003B507AE|nr:murein biosynthesis integral membrane protein MurJ [Desulfospira joergensenii]
MGKIFKKTSQVSGLTLVSRIMGLARDVLIASVFGASLQSDAFFMVFRPFDLMRKMFSDGIMSISFVPVFSRYLEQDRPDQARAMFMSALALISFVSVLLVLAGILLAPFLFGRVAPGFTGNPYLFNLTVVLVKIMMPYLIFVMLISLSMGVLNSFGNFYVSAATPILFNLVVILFTLLAAGLFEADIRVLATGVFAGGLVQLCFQVPFILKRLKPSLRDFCLLHPGFVRAGKATLPAMVGAASFQVNVMVASFFASSLSEGSVSYIYYSDRLVQFPLALLGGAFSAVLLPTLSRKAVSGSPDEISKIFEDGIRLVLFMTIPAMAGLMSLSRPLVTLFFDQGAFGPEAARHTAACLSYLALGLWAFAGTRLFVTLHYALSNVRLPFAAGMVSMTVNALLCLSLIKPMGFQGLALAVSLSGSAGFVLLFVWLPKGLCLSRMRIFVSACRAILLSGIMIIPVCWAAGLLRDVETMGRLGFGMGVTACVFLGVLVFGGLALGAAGPEVRLAKKWIKHKHQ